MPDESPPPAPTPRDLASTAERYHVEGFTGSAPLRSPATPEPTACEGGVVGCTLTAHGPFCAPFPSVALAVSHCASCVPANCWRGCHQRATGP